MFSIHNKIGKLNTGFKFGAGFSKIGNGPSLSFSGITKFTNESSFSLGKKNPKQTKLNLFFNQNNIPH